MNELLNPCGQLEIPGSPLLSSFPLLTRVAARVAPLSRAVAPDALSVAAVPVIAPAGLDHRHGLDGDENIIYNRIADILGTL